MAREAPPVVLLIWSGVVCAPHPSGAGAPAHVELVEAIRADGSGRRRRRRRRRRVRATSSTSLANPREEGEEGPCGGSAHHV